MWPELRPTDGGKEGVRANSPTQSFRQVFNITSVKAEKGFECKFSSPGMTVISFSQGWHRATGDHNTH